MTVKFTHVFINRPIEGLVGQFKVKPTEIIREDGSDYYLFETRFSGKFGLTRDNHVANHADWTELLHEAGPDPRKVARTLHELGVCENEIEASRGPSDELLAPLPTIRSMLRLRRKRGDLKFQTRSGAKKLWEQVRSQRLSALQRIRQKKRA